MARPTALLPVITLSFQFFFFKEHGGKDSRMGESCRSLEFFSFP
jgi:hypothetical protein